MVLLALSELEWGLSGGAKNSKAMSSGSLNDKPEP